MGLHVGGAFDLPLIYMYEQETYIHTTFTYSSLFGSTIEFPIRWAGGAYTQGKTKDPLISLPFGPLGQALCSYNTECRLSVVHVEGD